MRTKANIYREKVKREGMRGREFREIRFYESEKVTLGRKKVATSFHDVIFVLGSSLFHL